MVGVFLLTVLICSGIVACYAIRAIQTSFRNSIRTDQDIVFYNARNVQTYPHPAVMKREDSNPNWKARNQYT